MTTIEETENANLFQRLKGQTIKLNEKVKISEKINKASTTVKSDYQGSGVKGLIKNKYFIGAVSVLIVVPVLAFALLGGGNKYSFLLDGEQVKKAPAVYKSEIKSEPIFMDYLNQIADTPQRLYSKLKESECEPDILTFVKDNKELALMLLHFRVIGMLGGAKVQNAELVFVTNYIKSPTALAATNQQELGMETSIMRNMMAYKIYELFTAPTGLKEQFEEMFHQFAEYNKNHGAVKNATESS